MIYISGSYVGLARIRVATAWFGIVMTFWKLMNSFASLKVTLNK